MFYSISKNDGGGEEEGDCQTLLSVFSYIPLRLCVILCVRINKNKQNFTILLISLTNGIIVYRYIILLCIMLIY